MSALALDRTSSGRQNPISRKSQLSTIAVSEEASLLEGLDYLALDYEPPQREEIYREIRSLMKEEGQRIKRVLNQVHNPANPDEDEDENGFDGRGIS